VRDPEEPASTIRYQAVREEPRLYGDYSIVDRGVLADRGSAQAAGTEPREAP
jgi:hypothetical protein